MKCKELICAQSVVIDKTTNQVSIFNIYENIFSPFFPISLSSVALFIQFEREMEIDPLNVTFNLNIRLNENHLYTQPITISFTEGDIKNNTTVNLQNMIVAQPGNLAFIVEYNGEEKKVTSFKIEMRRG